MLILRSAAPSPFGRKVKIAMGILELDDRIEIKPADSNAGDEELFHQNPLGKIPTLILEDGSSLFDSRVILEYLDDLAGGGKIMPKGEGRFAALRLQALADGMMDASILQIYEKRFRPEEIQYRPWLDRQAAKVTRALAELENEPPIMGKPPHVGHIALACALGYLDLRFDGHWRDGHPKLVGWLDAFANTVPAFEATTPAG
ncbi:glutathione S-transferase family protein [Microbaculum marinisediminis]|uniref:Glutathione S-transferase family protein n=1 Tax=Microbaculum marinisediminis TaxID=2931392 RepID=A0AAW5R667_9HYPH|nr:glutathione S-transferase family protein [Microbaculum sp. A6E488]MCT8974875.1 glutathione S-transferase family protein [Microbaculum sp. A6E488]